MATEEEWRKHAYDVESGRRGNPSLMNTSNEKGYREYQQQQARDAAFYEAASRSMQPTNTVPVSSSVPIPDTTASPLGPYPVGVGDVSSEPAAGDGAIKVFVVLGALLAAIAAWVNIPGAWPQVVGSAVAGALGGAVLYGVLYVLGVLIGIAVKIVIFLLKIAVVVGLIAGAVYLLTHAG
jgi:hypothetical protein